MSKPIPSRSTRIDPIRFEVIRNRLTAIADEMALAVRRTAYSTNVKTRLDFSCAIFDQSLRMIAQSFSVPIHLGSLTHYVPRLLTQYGIDRLEPGDVIVTNDGHLGGVHLNDIVVVSPVFHGRDLVAFVSSLAHHVDVGGSTPGSIGSSREIFEDGIIIPPVRLSSDGRFDQSVLQLILRNVRTPREAGGDLRAQVAGVHTGALRLARMFEKYGLQVVVEAIEELLNYTERRVRRELAKLPSGVYYAEGHLDDDGVSDIPVKIAVKVVISPDKVLYDLTGSDPQRRCPINATYAMTLSNCAYTLRALMDRDLPTNDGLYRVLDVQAPEGTVVNAQFPASISGGWETGFRVCETAFQALAQAVPERLTAGSKGCLCSVMFGGIDPRSGDYFTFFDSLAGGYGARATRDGMDAVQPHVQNTENSPVEETESNYPVQIVRYELIPDSEGAGRFRGGLGLRRDYTFEAGVTFSVMADRAKFPPWGLRGGLAARPAHYIRNPDDGGAQYGSKFSVDLQPAEGFSVQMGGGGGYGPPWERDPTHVLADVAAGRISVHRAFAVYGVSIDEKRWCLDPEATRLKRQQLSQPRPPIADDPR